MMIKIGHEIFNTDHVARVYWKPVGEDRNLYIDIIAVSVSGTDTISGSVFIPKEHAERVWDYFAKDAVDLSS